MAYLIVLAGLIGAGKSTVVKKIMDKFDALVLNTDEIRGLNKNMKMPKDGYKADEETMKIRQETYDIMFKRAKDGLHKGKVVVLDGTFERKRWRESAKLVAEKMHVPCYIIEVVCEDEKELAKRVELRSIMNREVPPPIVAKQQREHYEKIAETEKIYTIYTGIKKDLDSQVEEVSNIIRGVQ